MKYLARCNSVFNKNDTELVGEDGTVFFKIAHAKLPIISGLKILNETNQMVYKVNFNPLKFKSRFQLLDANKNQVMGIGVGLKYLHKIDYNNKSYVCKGNIFRISYRLYDIDNVVATINVKKIDHQRFFEIELADNKSVMLALAMLIIAQSIRQRLFII